MKQYLKQLCSLTCAALMTVGLLSGCQTSGDVENLPSEPGELFVDDPFETDTNSNTEIIGWLSHGPENPVLDDDGLRVPYEYNGGPFELEYFVSATGSAKNVGFLLFLDGIPQPYQVNGEGDVDYMHTFELEKDDQEYPFSFVFTPVTGSVGDILELKIYSVYNAQFQPDMVTSSSYGLYHDTVEMTLKIIFNADAEFDSAGTSIQPAEAISSVTVTSDDMTSDFVSRRLEDGTITNGQTAEDLLESTVYSFIDYDGETVYNNLDVSNQDTVHITYQMVGVPGAVYRISLFANHRPLTDAEVIAWEVSLSKGKVTTLEADINVSALEDFTTFYVFACPVSRGSASDSVSLVGEKTDSILLYKGVSE